MQVVEVYLPRWEVLGSQWTQASMQVVKDHHLCWEEVLGMQSVPVAHLVQVSQLCMSVVSQPPFIYRRNNL